MKKLIFLFIIFSFLQLLGQQKNDSKEIIDLVVNNYKNDSIEVYHKFHNYELIKDFDNAESEKFLKITREIEKRINSSEFAELDEKEKAGIYLDFLWENIDADTVTVTFNKIKILLNTNKKLIDRKDNKRIKKYTKKNLTNKKKNKYAFISFPIISTDKIKAIIYVGYYCGSLCGKGGILHLEKLNGKWEIVEFVPTWIS